MDELDTVFGMAKEQKIIQCLYCGNKTLMDMVGQYRNSWDEDTGYYGYFLYKMFACPVCGKVTFYQTYWDCAQTNYDGSDAVDEEILYPINSIDSNAMPPKIKDAFESALKIRNIDSAVCLMALRRTLELICIDKGAVKWGLKDKIEELAEKGILPETLKEASSFTKILGDSATHDKGLDINIQDINSMIDFVEYIIEYLYVLPYKLERYKKRLESLEDAHNDK